MTASGAAWQAEGQVASAIDATIASLRDAVALLHLRIDALEAARLAATSQQVLHPPTTIAPPATSELWAWATPFEAAPATADANIHREEVEKEATAVTQEEAEVQLFGGHMTSTQEEEEVCSSATVCTQVHRAGDSTRELRPQSPAGLIEVDAPSCSVPKPQHFRTSRLAVADICLKVACGSEFFRVRPTSLSVDAVRAAVLQSAHVAPMSKVSIDSGSATRCPLTQESWWNALVAADEKKQADGHAVVIRLSVEPPTRSEASCK